MSEIKDPLNINIELAGVDTSLPLLPEQDYELQIVEATVGPNKDAREGKGTGRNLKVKFATTTASMDATGTREVKPNFPLFAEYALQPKEDSTDPEAFKRTLGELLDAVFQTDKTNRPNLTGETIQAMPGRKVIGHVTVNTWQGNQSNKVSRLRKAV